MTDTQTTELIELRKTLWMARDKLSYFRVLTSTMDVLDERTKRADRKVLLSIAEIDDAIYDLNSAVKQIENEENNAIVRTK